MTGDPAAPPDDLDVGQLMWDGVEGGGGSGGDLTWPLLAPDGTRSAPSYSFALDEFTGLYLAAAGDVRVAVDGSDVIGFDDRYITLGGQQQGVGRMSILSGSSGSPVYGFEGDIGTGIYRADSGVLGVSTGGVERLRVGASSTFTGDLTVDGDIHGGDIRLGVDGANIWGSNNGSNILAMVVAGQRRVEVNSTKVILRDDLQVGGQINFGAQAAGPIINLYNLPDGSNKYGFGLNTNLVAFWAADKQVGGFDSAGDLYLDGTVRATRGVAFSIATGIDTADVLERAETATMPTPDDEGVATTDADSLTVNEVVTALLAKVKEQSEQIAALTADVQELRGA